MHQKSIEEAKKRLFRGELVIFPTETVYGIGGNANNQKSIKLIYKTKNRPINNPLICHFANMEEIEKNFILKDKDYELANTFCFFFLTLILEKKINSMISPFLSTNKNQVGCRIPNNKISLSLLSIIDFPIAAPSANIATRTSVTSIEDLDHKLKEIFYIDGGSSVLGLESTVIKTTKNGCKILRLGSLTIEDIELKFPKYEISIDQSDVSPGNQLKHYSPIKPIRINVNFVKKNETLLNFGINELTSDIKSLNLSIDENLSDASYNFYNYLNILDNTNCSGIAVAPIPDQGLGKTINDRLRRASYKDE